MTAKNMTGISTSKDLQVGEEPDYISYDAPPLDFSFKNIKSLDELKTTQPRQGQKKKTIEQVKGKQQAEEKQEIERAAEGEEGDHKGEKRKNQITKLLPQNNINSVVATLVTTSAMKNISLKAKQQLEKKKKKAIHVKLVCSALMLGYNKIRQIAGMDLVMSGIMQNFASLQWIDLSHNYLVGIDYDFQHFPQLKTIYLHCNFIWDFAQVERLTPHQQLKTFTIHGNPLTAIANFRILVISILPQLKKLDSVLISKKERDNAVFIRSQTKKYPVPKNIPKPPVEKKEEDEQQKQ